MIETREISYRYSRKKEIFEDLSFRLAQGGITGLFGLNGEGKTTLLKLLAGQLLYKSGEIKIFDEDPKQRRVSFLHSVFYLPEVIKVPKGITVGRFFDTMKVFYPNFSDDVAQDALAAFGLKNDRVMKRGSQGEQKKMMLAFALALRAPVLLLDEPTNGLDIPSKGVFRRLIAKHITEEQTIIISTHQVRDLEQVIDRVMVLQDAHILLNESLFDLTERFCVRETKTGEAALYTEITPMGQVGLFERKEGDEYNFSTELFFNGLLANKGEVLRLLSKTNE